VNDIIHRLNIITVLSVFLIADAFSQTNTEAYSSFENRKKQGYYNITQFAMLMGNQLSSSQQQIVDGLLDDRTTFQISPSFTMVNGIMFNEHWGGGLGLGFEIFDRNLFPVFAELRCTLWDNDVSPFFVVKMGHAISGFKEQHHDMIYLSHQPFNINNAYFKKKGGFMFNPEMGVKIPLSRKSDMLVTVAYRFQKIQSIVYQDLGQKPKWNYKATMNRLSSGIAIMFR